MDAHADVCWVKEATTVQPVVAQDVSSFVAAQLNACGHECAAKVEQGSARMLSCVI